MINDLVVHTPTLEDYIRIITYLFSTGVAWSNGSTDIKREYWNLYKKNTCVHIRTRVGTCIPHAIYGCYTETGITTLSVNDFYSKCRCEKALKELR